MVNHGATRCTRSFGLRWINTFDSEPISRENRNLCWATLVANTVRLNQFPIDTPPAPV
ncbi:Uncharacterised protein [Mycobacterium tuberculosis]|uniref:Uncharacterized protein n=1 Tax=Mycobacterium tuberculosis TaxID=1773 RepID=A0A655FBW4_MYCTX|nr:Uncharacterised protein [Mycobacterium tuberculosis]CNV63956.1 Uncharacterised protein [Mycobacterium tuberculosis]